METLYEGEHVRIKKEDGWEFVERTGSNTAVCIIGFVKSKLIAISQLRIPTGERVLELPAGMMEDDETPQDTALRELKEETGYTATKEDIVGVWGPTYPSPGLTNEKVYFVEVWIKGEKGEQDQDPEEDITVHVEEPHILKQMDITKGSKLAAFLL